MSWLSTGLQLAGLGVSLYSSYQSSKSAKDYGRDVAADNIRVAKDNAAISRYDASVAVETANNIFNNYNTELRLHYENLDAFLGKQKTGYAKGGVRVGSGSALEVQAKSAAAGQRDAQRIRYNGQTAREAALDTAKRYNLLAEKGMRDGANQAAIIESAYEAKAQNALWSGVGNAATSLYRIGSQEDWW